MAYEELIAPGARKPPSELERAVEIAQRIIAEHVFHVDPNDYLILASQFLRAVARPER
jgi:hypothetical protein